MKISLLFLERDHKMSIDTVYNRLLTVFVPKVRYTRVLKNALFYNAIVIETDLPDSELYNEVTEILPMIGYIGKYEILKPIEH